VILHRGNMAIRDAGGKSARPTGWLPPLRHCDQAPVARLAGTLPPSRAKG
jgi:hypothetical protein